MDEEGSFCQYDSTRTSIFALAPLPLLRTAFRRIAATVSALQTDIAFIVNSTHWATLTELAREGDQEAKLVGDQIVVTEKANNGGEKKIKLSIGSSTKKIIKARDLFLMRWTLSILKYKKQKTLDELIKRRKNVSDF
ncbi:hypothetical protein L2E82_36646 [Cichorium intybus]|uniref:Uncharacterized protein n=1 Tax=Cichorium intybus TaxID=13427 RepID=A0ACB9AC45_CICIN|nr:hypothetical protein L2E82_36646 [Cichorium intybus]